MRTTPTEKIPETPVLGTPHYKEQVPMYPLQRSSTVGHNGVFFFNKDRTSGHMHGFTSVYYYQCVSTYGADPVIKSPRRRWEIIGDLVLCTYQRYTPTTPNPSYSGARYGKCQCPNDGADPVIKSPCRLLMICSIWRTLPYLGCPENCIPNYRGSLF